MSSLIALVGTLGGIGACAVLAIVIFGFLLVVLFRREEPDVLPTAATLVVSSAAAPIGAVQAQDAVKALPDYFDTTPIDLSNWSVRDAAFDRVVDATFVAACLGVDLRGIGNDEENALHRAKRVGLTEEELQEVIPMGEGEEVTEQVVRGEVAFEDVEELLDDAPEEGEE